MFYESDFKILNYQEFSYVQPSKHKHEINDRNQIDTKPVKNKFSFVIISKNNEIVGTSDYSLAVAAKPLIIFSSLVGLQTIRYKGNEVVETKWWNKLYSLFLIMAYITLTVLVRPESWNYTKTDHPLNILTKVYSILIILEVIHFTFTTSFRKTTDFVQLFKKLNEIDNHFDCSKTVFKRRRLVSVLFLLLPVIEILSFFSWRTFRIQNIGSYITFFMLTLQGSLIGFMIMTVFVKLLNLNTTLENKVKSSISNQKATILHKTIGDSLFYMICKEPIIIKKNNLQFCWFELMQIYDKIADCVYLFNRIYCGQIFFTFNSWLLCTILVICRSLSPSIKYSEVFLSDLYLYTCLYVRPLFLAIICEMLIRQRKKTLTLLIHLLLPEKELAYISQVETMIMLVLSRKLEISASAFTVNVPTIMNFAGRIISYIVLIIQYFYRYVFLKLFIVYI